MSNWSKIANALPLAAFLLTVAILPRAIAWLKRLHFGQNIREEGPKEHQKKAGTPTMGGIIFVPVGIVAGLALDYAYSLNEAANSGTTRTALILAAFTLGGLFIGWLDDYRSIKFGKSLGLKAREKLVLQFVVSAVFLYLAHDAPVPVSLRAATAIESAQAWYHWVALLFVCVWLINAANLADGLDGLAASQALIAILSIFLGVWALGVYGHLSGFLGPVAMIGALLGFLCFNAPPARVFMGDTGSIALGCFVVGYGMMCVPLYILLFATAVWSLEALSVVIQVIYFKLSGGKRIFKMSPIHHHFELCGWPESHVTMRFVALSIVCGILLPMALAGWSK